ncbi:MAG: phosphogluconate dehydrogenase (NADP(+)-dependent, decarboxylating) [Spirochaetae bacterium HGW-Spirochaetae-7]|nr:MAG: phosphogluconate dehydrogenase (NADP(+)-dependent, decarboxylating) [Spirochaetae bacterium HGW-Spirochaetae-7]
MKETADIGLIGLAVMGRNLVLNMNDKGFSVAVYNRTTSKVDEFIDDEAKGRATILPAHTIEEFMALLKRPRKVMLMVKAGEVVDQFIESLLPFLEAGDIIIDGGNSHFPDTSRRTAYLAEKGILFVGTGVSGGEEGARNGPSLMPGGNPEAWPFIKPIFQAIAARTDSGEPCCDWVGPAGAGHFVKMVHNGIEYGDMQLIAEAYHLMKSHVGLDAGGMKAAFDGWMRGDLNGYLVEIASDILGFNDDDGSPLLEKILDTAGQKGTGKWTAVEALDMGVPVTLIGEAVFARCLSALKDERVRASAILGEGEPVPFKGNVAGFIADLGEALLASKLVSYAQGYMLMREAAREFGWDLNYGGIAMMWRGGCIIRSVFLDKIKAAFDRNPGLENLLLDDWFSKTELHSQTAWRKIVSAGVNAGIPLPAMGSALSFFDGYRTARLPANMLQALRDYFGAHTYERTDRPRGEFFHTNWTGEGGNVSAGIYTV